MSIKFAVIIEGFAERYYIKKFLKKYKEKKWQITQEAIEEICTNPLKAIEKNKLETIVDGGDVLICKLDFAVAGMSQSPRSSGNRAIIAVHKDRKLSRILFIYHKNDLGKGNETASWKAVIKNNFPEYKKLL